jgi:predicted Zn-dependent protease
MVSGRMALAHAPSIDLSSDTVGAFRIDLQGRTQFATAAFAALWSAGWLLTIVSSLTRMARLGHIELGTAAWMSLWIGAGVPVLIALAWAAAGRCETILIADGRVRIIRPLGPFRSALSLDAEQIRGLRLVPVPHPLMVDLFAIKDFWFGGAGPIALQHQERRYAIGSALDPADATRLMEDIAALLPAATTIDGTIGTHHPSVRSERPEPVETEASDAEPRQTAPPPAVKSPADHGMVACAAMALLLPALIIPVRLGFTERSICFCEDPAPAPQEPVDVASMQAPGRIYLVPLDGYSSERARAIADHSRQQFKVRIRVEPELTTDVRAFDPGRGKANASELLSILESRYPESSVRTVVIGLTEADMFVPEAGSQSVFTYRRAHRIAVVSSARMDQGCLGLFAVSEERQLARMRKVVGRNIGLMYFRLAVNHDPHSLLYASMAGPQHLDVMSESF